MKCTFRLASPNSRVCPHIGSGQRKMRLLEQVRFVLLGKGCSAGTGEAYMT